MMPVKHHPLSPFVVNSLSGSETYNLGKEWLENKDYMHYDYVTMAGILLSETVWKKYRVIRASIDKYLFK